MAGYKVPHFSVNTSVLKVAVQVTHHVADGFAVCMRGPVDHVGAEPSQRGRRGKPRCGHPERLHLRRLVHGEVGTRQQRRDALGKRRALLAGDRILDIPPAPP